MSIQQSHAQPDAPDQLAQRDVAALTEAMTVVENDPAAWSAAEVAVYSGETSKYVVNVDTQFCECADHAYRGAQCKHIRRARYALGLDDIPDWVRRDRLDPSLRRRIDSNDPATTFQEMSQ